jgi:hypothetical protein
MTATSVTMYDTTGAAFRRIPFPRPGVVTTNQYAVLASESPHAEPWQDIVAARLAELERLAPNWDSDGGFPVARRHANRAFAFINRLMDLGISPMPDIVPLADGGVQVEWHMAERRRIDFITDEDSEPVVLIQDGDTLTERPARLVDLSDLHEILKA